MVTARWFPLHRPERRPLTPYAREAEQTTLQLLEGTLLKPGTPPTNKVQHDLRQSAPRDVADLLPHLEQRGRAVIEAATRRLAARATDEAAAMRQILEGQKARIVATARQHAAGTVQGLLPFPEEERRQLEADRRHWDRRLAEIDRELEREPERVRAVYDVRADRVEPVGLVYLWPVSG